MAVKTLAVFALVLGCAYSLSHRLRSQASQQNAILMMNGVDAGETISRANIVKRQQKLTNDIKYHADKLSSLARRNEGTLSDSADELSFLDRSSPDLDPLQAQAAAATLHAQADALRADVEGSLRVIRRLRYQLGQKVKELLDQKEYAKRIAATIAEDRLVVARKERLITSTTGKVLLRVATDELTVLRAELIKVRKGIVNASNEIALARKFIAVREAGATELSEKLTAFSPRVLQADVAFCEAASAFAASKIPIVKKWSLQGMVLSLTAVQELQLMVVKCASHACVLLPGEDSGNETEAVRFAGQRGDGETTTESLPGTTSAPASTASPEALLKDLRSLLSRPDGLLAILRATQAALQILEDALQEAREQLGSAKEQQRQSISEAELRFQTARGNDTDSRIASLARDIVRKELRVQSLLDKLALQRAAFHAVRNVAKTRAVARQAKRVYQNALDYKAGVELRCLPLLKPNATSTDDDDNATTSSPELPRLKETDAHAEDGQADEMF